MTPENIGSPIRSIPSSTSGAAAAPTAFRDFRQLVGIPVSIANFDTVCANAPHVRAVAGMLVAGSSSDIAQPTRLTTIHNPAKLIGYLPALTSVAALPPCATAPAAAMTALEVPQPPLRPRSATAMAARDAVIAAGEAPIQKARQLVSGHSSQPRMLDASQRAGLATGSAAMRLAAMKVSGPAVHAASPNLNEPRA